eukprot:CAMPEP_0194520008 /NCGR_PEP_ID=MMETSP0253-20130528/53864_1 /TAXON_ID=2966 /ORGANISM="Noctiluca scintillans" /LENGTH=95 /DNA_ID=CAMNT_0039364203 /DNA_START=275 /DNA_END=559 /DNA_ORIENTATION=+
MYGTADGTPESSMDRLRDSVRSRDIEHAVDVVVSSIGGDANGDWVVHWKIMLSLLISSMALTAMTMLGGFHMLLVLSNQTTIEVQGNIALGFLSW